MEASSSVVTKVAFPPRPERIIHVGYRLDQSSIAETMITILGFDVWDRRKSDIFTAVIYVGGSRYQYGKHVVCPKENEAWQWFTHRRGQKKTGYIRSVYMHTEGKKNQVLIVIAQGDVDGHPFYITFVGDTNMAPINIKSHCNSGKFGAPINSERIEAVFESYVA